MKPETIRVRKKALEIAQACPCLNCIIKTNCRIHTTGAGILYENFFQYEECPELRKWLETIPNGFWAEPPKDREISMRVLKLVRKKFKYFPQDVDEEEEEIPGRI